MNGLNPRWYNREHTAIVLDLEFADLPDFPHLQGFHPFVANQDDPHEHGREIFKKAVAGAFGQIGEWGV